MQLGTLIGCPMFFDPAAIAVFVGSTGLTLCLGHSLGMHRRLIQTVTSARSGSSTRLCIWVRPSLRWLALSLLLSFICPITCLLLRAVQRCCILSCVRLADSESFFLSRRSDRHTDRHGGTAGNDSHTRHARSAWRQPRCHDYFGHRRPIWQDAWWQMHCELHLTHPPLFRYEPRVGHDAFYAFLERTWMWQQLPWAALLWLAGGAPFVVWGVCARVAVSVGGHWLVGFFAHRDGQRSYDVAGAAVQGHNVRGAGNLLCVLFFIRACQVGCN